MSSLRLTQSLQQRMILTPQLRQRIEMLQMTATELNDLIETEMMANPLLEEVMPGDEVEEITSNILDQNSNGTGDDLIANNGDFSADNSENSGSLQSDDAFNDHSDYAESSSAEDSQSSESGDAFDEIDFGREFQDYLDPGYKTQEYEVKDDAPSFEQFLTHSPSLGEHLEWQLNLLDLPSAVENAGIIIIGNLDNDGRLSSTIEEIAQMSQCSSELAEKARLEVMHLDPVGCAAFDVKECLVVQLRTLEGDTSTAQMLVSDHFEDLQPHRLQHLMKSTGLDIERISQELETIKRLDPFPGRRYASDEAMYVTPEVYIEKVDDDYVVFFADDGLSRLRISPTYNQIAEKSDTSKETKDFIKDKFRSAVDLLRNIEHRRQTIYRVVECIVRRQREFLDHGVEYIKPMMLKDVAEDIGMHLSTISRVVNRKYAHTPQGVIEIRRFFSEGMLNEDGEEVSTRILKLKIKKMIEDENTKQPLTDDEIAGILGKEGVKLSRRTVAKYRDQMNIPGSRERRTIV